MNVPGGDFVPPQIRERLENGSNGHVENPKVDHGALDGPCRGPHSIWALVVCSRTFPRQVSLPRKPRRLVVRLTDLPRARQVTYSKWASPVVTGQGPRMPKWTFNPYTEHEVIREELDMLDFDVILRMDWLYACYVSIDRRTRLVTFKARKMISKGYIYHLIWVGDNDSKTTTLESVPIGVHLVDFNEGGVVVHNGYESSFILNMKAKQDLDLSSIGMAPFEALYGMRCRLKMAQSRQKSYADVRRREIEFEVNDWVYLKISPMKGVMRFGKKGKLSPHYVGQYQILRRIDKVAYELELPNDLASVHPIFHVSLLKKCVGDLKSIVPLEGEVKGNLSYEKVPIEILDQQVQKFINKEVSFVKGPTIFLIPLVASWLEHLKFKSWKWISPRCALKVDLRKAYDTLEWGVIRKLLIDMGFPAKFIHWIITHVSIVSYSLMLNGGLTPPFIAKRGIRQGDPMSPYLFVLAMEYLGRKLNQLARNGNFNFHPRCRKLGSVHICFADDLLMYCRADIISVRLLREAFTKFPKASGLQANVDKSSLYIVGVANHTKEEILEELRYLEGDNFSIHKMYTRLMPQFPRVDWKAIAIYPRIHPRVKFFVWLAVQKRLATVDRLIKLGIQVPPDCA
ncbi:hypothetical protein MTR67_051453 [Solanum verrucosum]|uniref:Reverse transcriptase domain-containing protein n=1 Tax=Solanum verrucosum TaxID=315347 RepID=A0AAF1A244_SOLVR|nr:hypothetical protein MTR67_051453 [Solanum verrucosum]